MHHSNQEKKEIQYFYRGKLREAQVTIINASSIGSVYWFHFRSGPPSYISKKDGVWLMSGTTLLTAEIEKGDLYLALATAIEEQIINKF